MNTVCTYVLNIIRKELLEGKKRGTNLWGSFTLNMIKYGPCGIANRTTEDMSFYQVALSASLDFLAKQRAANAQAACRHKGRT